MTIQLDDPQAPPPAFGVTLPAAWLVLDLETLNQRQYAADLIADRVEQGLLEPEWAEIATDVLSDVAGEALGRGAQLAAGLVFDDGGTPGFVSLTASFERYATPDPVSQAATHAADDDLQITLRGDDAAPKATERGVSAERVTLPAGQALRTERFVTPIAPSAPDGTPAQEYYVVQYMLPVDDDGLVLTLTAASGGVFQQAEINAAIAQVVDTLEFEHES